MRILKEKNVERKEWGFLVLNIRRSMLCDELLGNIFVMLSTLEVYVFSPDSPT
jgi:hypothetical protein